MIATIGHSRVWLVMAMLTAFMALSWFIAAPTAMASDPDAPPVTAPVPSEYGWTKPFRVIGWSYLPQSESFGNEWGADVVLNVTYKDGYRDSADVFVLDWVCFWELIIGLNGINAFNIVPYFDAGDNYPDGFKRLLRLDAAVTFYVPANPVG